MGKIVYKLREQCIDIVFMLMLILSTGGLLFVYNRFEASISFLCLFVVNFLFILVFILRGKTNWKKNIVNAILLSFITLFFIGMFNYFAVEEVQTAKKYLFHLLTIVLSCLFLFHFQNNRTYEQLIKSLYVALGFILIHATFNFIASFFVANYLTAISINSLFNNHECETFFYIFFYTTDKGAINLFGIEFFRNQGLFWEPGILQVFLNMFFFLQAFIIRKRKGLLLLTAVVIITTYSTTGLALLLIQSVVYLFNDFKAKKWLIPALFLLFIPIYIVFSLNIEEKVIGEKEASFQKRLFDLVQPMIIARENPLTGIGLDILKFQEKRQEVYLSASTLSFLEEEVGVESKIKGTDKGSSNSIMFLFAAMGFPTAILLLYMFFKQQIIKQKKWLWMLLMVVSAMSEPLLLRPFFFVFIVSGFTYIFHTITSHKQQIA